MGYKETWSGKISRKLLKKQRIIDVAAGRCKADLVLKNATYINVFSGELETRDIAVAEGLIVGLGSYEGIPVTTTTSVAFQIGPAQPSIRVITVQNGMVSDEVLNL